MLCLNNFLSAGLGLGCLGAPGWAIFTSTRTTLSADVVYAGVRCDVKDGKFVQRQKKRLGGRAC